MRLSPEGITISELRRLTYNLLSRGNRVFVLLGPFNEHLLTENNRKEYEKRKAFVESWFREQKLAYLAPPPLASASPCDDKAAVRTTAMIATLNFDIAASLAAKRHHG